MYCLYSESDIQNIVCVEMIQGNSVLWDECIVTIVLTSGCDVPMKPAPACSLATVPTKASEAMEHLA